MVAADAKKITPEALEVPSLWRITHWIQMGNIPLQD